MPRIGQGKCWPGGVVEENGADKLQKNKENDNMGDKVAESMAVIKGADGPTSFFIGGKANQKRTLK